MQEESERLKGKDCRHRREREKGRVRGRVGEKNTETEREGE